jgi:5-methylcytosine-specific restriction endonuclease McrA
MTNQQLTKNRQKVLSRYLKDRAACIKLYGSRCCQCGFDDERALEFDHIHGTQAGISVASLRTRAKSYGGGINVFSGLLRGKLRREDFQLLCANCHAIKTKESKEYLPRQSRSAQVMEELAQEKLF